MNTLTNTRSIVARNRPRLAGAKFFDVSIIAALPLSARQAYERDGTKDKCVAINCPCENVLKAVV